MSVQFQISTDAEQVLRRFKRLPKEVQRGAAKGLKRGLLLADTRIRTNTQVKFRRGGAGLGGRLTNYVRTSGEIGLQGAIGFRKTRGFPYEMSQEFGAKAKPGKAMAIPVSTQAKAAGGPRNMEGLTLVKGEKQAVLAEISKKGRIRVHFVLVKSIKPRLRFRENVRESMPEISQELVLGAREGLMGI